MRNPILENQIVPITRPTDNQKAVLAKITAAATPQLALADIADTPNLVAARDLLVQMGLIDIDDEGAHLTDKGQEVMTAQNLATSDGTLTDDGQAAAYGDEAEDAAPAPDDDMDFDFGGEDGGEEDGEFDFDFGDEEGDEDEGEMSELDPRAMDSVKEPKESFNLLTSLRRQAVRETYQIPIEFEAKLSEEEIDQLNYVVQGASIHEFDSLYKKAFSHFVSEMPYGVAKARSGDPGEWLENKFKGRDTEEEDS